MRKHNFTTLLDDLIGMEELEILDLSHNRLETLTELSKVRRVFSENLPKNLPILTITDIFTIIGDIECFLQSIDGFG